MKYLFVMNPKSGPAARAKKLIKQVEKIFCHTNHDYDFAFTTGPGDATELAKKGVLDGYDIIVAAGGDGTVNELAAGLVNCPAAMGIIPLGSGNGIARSLQIPLGMKASIKSLLNPNIIKIDIGKINGNIFVGVAGVGFDARVGDRFQKFGIRGPVPYFLIGVWEFLHFSPDEIDLICDGRKISVSVFLLAFANTRQYGNGAIIAPDADPADGMLDICYFESLSLPKALLLFIKMFRGKINTAPEYHHFRAEKVQVKSKDRNYVFHTDGEPKKTATDLTIDILPAALKICVGSPA